MKNYITFKNPYILVEDCKNKFQPFYKEYSQQLPNFNLDSPSLCCPFSTARRSQKPKKKNPIISGFCEMCYMRFDDYEEHVLTKEHMDFAHDDYNYRHIDLFIQDFLEKELYESCKYMNSPCERLEEKFASSSQVYYNNESGTGSVIVMSFDSSATSNEVVEFDLILNKIDKKYPSLK